MSSKRICKEDEEEEEEEEETQPFPVNFDKLEEGNENDADDEEAEDSEFTKIKVSKVKLFAKGGDLFLHHSNKNVNTRKAADAASMRSFPSLRSSRSISTRGHWSGRFDFLLSLLGYSIGLGNVWRFPYLCYKNGGGAFLLPFIIMMLIAGLPLMFMELSLGQYSSMGPSVVFERFCPLFVGLGYGMVIISSMVMLYYNMILAWTIYYMWVSIDTHVPWQECKGSWASESCFSYSHSMCLKKNVTNVFYNFTCYSKDDPMVSNVNITFNPVRHTPGSEFFERAVLEKTEGIEQIDGIRPQMAISLLIAWLVVFLCLVKGVRSSGKVVYFTALFPFFLLIVLFIRGITLPGAINGIIFYITPRYDLLLSTDIWGDAAVQIFFALSPAWGGLITLSSYNRFDNNCFRDALIVSLSNICTSIFAGFAVFSIIGYLAEQSGESVSKVVDQGLGLAFKVYPEVVSKLPFAPLWSFLFFFMLFTLGLDTQFALLETVQTALLDKFPQLRTRKVIVLASVCFISFIFGLIFTTGSGIYWLHLFDTFVSTFSVLILALVECCLIGWVYGADKFLNDIERMIGIQGKLFHLYWKLNWKFLSPFSLMFILFFSFAKSTKVNIGNYFFPTWAEVIGWNISFLPIYQLVLMIIWTYYKSDLTLRFTTKIWLLMQPKDSWLYLRRRAHEKNESYIGTNVLGSELRMLSLDTNNNNSLTTISAPRSDLSLVSKGVQDARTQKTYDNPAFNKQQFES